MKKKTPKEPTDPEARIAELVRTLREAEAELQALTGGQLDAVASEGDIPYLLRDAQEKLRLQAAAQQQAAEMQISILNALPAHIALLDDQGTILTVNEAWRRFASANVLKGTDFFVGQNYLGVCESAHGDCADEAQSAADGIRQVLRGEVKEFSLEYPCHSPTEQRWFRLMVTPLSETPGAGAVVMHVNVTQRRLAEEAIREQEATQRRLAEALTVETKRLHESQAVANVGSWETDLTTLQVTWTHETYRIFETNPEEFKVTHEGFLERVHPEDRERVDAAFRASAGEPGPFAIEHRLLFPDGRIKFVEERWQAFKDESGNPVRAVGTCQDITERKKAEQAVTISEASLARAQRIAHMGNWDWNIVTGELYWSAEVFRLFGIDPAEASGTYERFLKGVHPEDRDRTDQAVMDAVEGRAPYNVEHRVLWPDGTVRVMHEQGEVMRDAEGRPLNMIGTVQDITERKQAEEQLRQREQLLGIAGKVARIGGWSVDFPAVRITWSDEACAIHDVPVGTVPTLDHALAFYTPESRPVVESAFTLCRLEGTPFDQELELLTAKGRRIWVRVIGEAERDAAGTIKRVQGATQDITEQKSAQIKLQQSESLRRIAGAIAKVGGWSISVPDSHLYWADEIYDILDYPRGPVPSLEEALGFYPEPWQTQLTTAISTCATHGTPFDLDLMIKSAKGRLFWARCKAEAELDEKGRIVQVRGAFQDITEQKAAEDRIRELDGRLVNTLETITDAFFTIDREWRFTYLNAEAEKLLERDRASLLGRNIWDEFPAGVGSTFQREYERAFEAMQAVSFEEYFGPLSKWFEVRAFPSNDGLAVYFHDVTELRVSREALAASEKEFRNLAEAMPQIVWITRADGWNTYFNQHWMDYTGLTLEESLGHGWNKPFHPEDQQRAWDAWELATTTVGVYALECRLRRADGEYRWWLIRGEPQKDADGNILKWFGTCTDIHEIKVAELEILRTNRALKLLSGCNEVLIHADDEMTLLRDLCELAVQTGGYRMAWVGYAQDDEMRSITPMAHAGVEDGYLAEVSVTWDEQSPSGQGPAGRVIRNGEAIICEDLETDEFTMWLEQARQRGYRSVICLPLRDKQRPFGLLALYSAEVDVTNAEELKLLQEMADDLAFGVLTLRTRIDQRRTHEAVLTMARGISVSTSDEFFQKLTFSMVEALGAHAGFIARLNDDKSMATTLCAVVDGKLVADFEYALSGTPCEHLDREDVWVVPKDAQQCYPQARMLQDLEIKAYVGTELKGADGKACGMLFVLFRQPLEQHEFISSTLKIFASRAAGELARQRTDARLREQAALLDKAQDAILVRDLDHKILYWNRSAERLYGWSAEEAVGRTAAELIYQDTAPLDAALKALMEEGEWVGEAQHVTKEGKALTVEGRLTLVRDDQGNPKSVLAINTDVTERKKIEAQYLRAQRMESIGTLAGGIAHDLNNVLAPIMMSIELLKMQEKDPMRLNVLTAIEGSTLRGAEMVKQVLSFARGVEGQQMEVQVGHLLREVQKIANETFLKNIQVSCGVPRNLWPVKGDPTQLHQVLLNLCVNARDAMPDGGRLALTASNLNLDELYVGMNIEAEPGPYVCVEVEDSGTGMPPDVIERIFEPFFTTKELGKGTGLGLSTSIAIVKSHGGFVRVYSEVGIGTRFHVYLPAQTETGAADSEASEPELPRGNGELVLVIDDEAAVRQITRQTLEAFGYSVLLASDGVEATSIYATRQHEIKVVLTDMMMPLMDGPTTIHVLLRMNPQARIIAASGLNANGMVAKATNAGVKHFIPKPYTAETLLRTLRAVLE